MGYEKAKEKERDVSWLELFYDLVFAAAIAQLGQNLSHNLSVQGFVEYVVLFVNYMLGLDRGNILCHQV